MSVSIAGTTDSQIRTRRITRYAFGSALIVCAAYTINWPLAYLTPVLALMFLGSPAPVMSLKKGVGFVIVVGATSLIGVLIARFLLPYPLIYIPMSALFFLHIFYATPKQIPPFVKVFLLLSIGAIPFLGLQSLALSVLFAYGLTLNALATVILVWAVYGLFPDKRVVLSDTPKKIAAEQTPKERLKVALISLTVVFPVFILFMFYQMTGAVLVLIYVILLTAQPGFAKDFKAGGFMLLANIAGGLTAILLYELLVMVSVFPYLLLLILLVGLLFGSGLFSNKPTAPLYGTAFSTVLVIIGMTTNSQAEADAKAYTRIFQTMVSVVYVVTASGFITALVQSFSKTKIQSDE